MPFEPLCKPYYARRFVLTVEDIVAQRGGRPRLREPYDARWTGAGNEVTITTGRKEKPLIKPDLASQETLRLASQGREVTKRGRWGHVKATK